MGDVHCTNRQSTVFELAIVPVLVTEQKLVHGQKRASFDKFVQKIVKNQEEHIVFYTVFAQVASTTKKTIRVRIRGIFKSEVKNKCFNYQLAMSLLQHPARSTHVLLELWDQYKQTPAYEAEKERSRRVDAGDGAAVAQKAAHGQRMTRGVLHMCEIT